MAVHAMTKAEIDEIERHERAVQQDVRETAEAKDEPRPAGLVVASSILESLEDELGQLATSLVTSASPVDLLWRRLFVGEEAAYLRLLQAVRLAEGFAAWPDGRSLVIGDAADQPDTLIARQVGRAAALTARWQQVDSGDAQERARSWATERYGLDVGQCQIAQETASAIEGMLRSGWGETALETVPYQSRLATHHRLRMLFVEYAGLALLVHLRGNGLKRVDSTLLQEDMRRQFPGSINLASAKERWPFYRWLARCIQRVYADDPDQVFLENDAIVRTDPFRATIADTISGPFFIHDGRIARDESNLHWSRSGLGREEENSFFNTDFTTGVFRCAQTMRDDLARYVAAAVMATERSPVYLYDGASGSGAVARSVVDLLRRKAPQLAGAVRWQLTDVSAASLQAAWEACSDYPELSVHLADLSSPLIRETDHGTFDIAGQNLGAHHLPDERYASMIRGLVSLTRPGGIIYLGDVDSRMGLQVLNGLWANLYAVEWPRTSRDPYKMFPRPSMLAVRSRSFDDQQFAMLREVSPVSHVDQMYKIMVPIPADGRTYPADIEFYTTGFGYVNMVSKAQLDEIDRLVADGQEWKTTLSQPGTLSAQLARHQANFAERLQAALVVLS